jgi:2-methylcitrate dehydratase PrpD
MTETIVRFVRSTGFEDLPGDVVVEAKRSLTDFLAVAFAGVEGPGVDRLAGLLASYGGAPQATVIGNPARTSTLFAALLNGTMAHVLDFDDTHMPSMLHPGAVVIPAVAAVGETLGCNGRAALAAVALGCEVGTRLGNAVCRSHAYRGWHTSGTVGTVAAAVGAAKVAGLDAAQMEAALGLAATQAAGLIDVFGTMGKSLNLGRAAASGVLAAQLAQRGFTAGAGALESDRGFFRVFATQPEVNALTDRLGMVWESARIGRKPYPCGVVLHPAIDAALRLREPLGGEVSGIERIELRVHPDVLYLTGKTEPASGLEGKFSVTHCVAVALADGAVGVTQFADARLRDAELTTLRRKVVATADPGLRTDEAVVDVITSGGRRLCQHVPHATGTVDNPMTNAELAEKLRRAAEPRLGAGGVDQLRAAVWTLETRPSLGPLLALCAAPA